MSTSAPAVNSMCAIWNSLQIAHTGCELVDLESGVDRCRC